MSLDPLFDIKQILLSSDQAKGSAKGKQALEDCVDRNLVTFSVKNLVKRRIVNYLVKNYSYYPPMHVKQNLAQCVAGQLFGKLSDAQKLDIKNLFYSESKLCKDAKRRDANYKRIPASGLIEDRLKYLRRKNEVTNRKMLRSTPSADYRVPTTDEDQEKKSWLANSTTPIFQVTEYMSDTYTLRTSQIKNSANLSATLQEWPRLLDSPGMVDQDFGIQHPGKNEAMLRKWPMIAKQICDFAEKMKCKAVEDVGIMPLMSNWSQEQISVGALVMLPYMTSSSAYSKKNNKKRKLTAAHSAEFFVQFVSATDDIESLRVSETRRKQPFVLCVGDLVNLVVTDSYVMVERRLVKAASLVNAVDLCFKLFHVLQLQFPDECFPVWSFFDHSVYQINEIASPPSSVLALGSQITM